MIVEDTNSFNRIYTKYYQKSFLFVKSYVHDELVAEDIVSEGLIKLWEILKENRPEFTGTFLLTILKNKALDYLKHESIKENAIRSLTDLGRQELEIRISTLQACDPEEIFSTEVRKIIAETLATLPEQTKIIFQMSRFENKTNKEIAGELNISVKGVEYHITKALKILRINLKDYLHSSYSLLFFIINTL